MAKNDYTQKQTNKNNSENTQKNQSKNSTKESTSDCKGAFEGCNADEKRSRCRTDENPGAPAPFWVGRNFGAFSLTAHRKCPYNKKSEKSKKRCRGKDACA